MDKNLKEKALQLHRESIIIDGLHFVENLSGHDLSQFEGRYGDELKKSGVSAANFTVESSWADQIRFIKGISGIYKLIDKYGEQYLIVKTSRDIEKAKQQGQVGIIMGSQGPEQIGYDVKLLRIYKELGVRIIQPTYYEQSPLGEGCGDRTDAGLSNLGIEFVKEMNRLHMLIDLSHCGPKLTMEATELSEQPVVCTHTGPRVLVDHIRNKSDEILKAIANKGGVIGVTLYTSFCEIRKGSHPTFEDFMAMVDYIVKLIGPDHVGIGFDINQESPQSYASWSLRYPNIPGRFTWRERNILADKDGWIDIGQWIKITEWLVDHGYSDEDIKKILGLNFLNVFKEVWGE